MKCLAGSLALLLACAIFDDGFAQENLDTFSQTQVRDLESRGPGHVAVFFSRQPDVAVHSNYGPQDLEPLYDSHNGRSAESFPREIAPFRDPRKLASQAQPHRLQRSS